MNIRLTPFQTKTIRQLERTPRIKIGKNLGQGTQHKAYQAIDKNTVLRVGRKCSIKTGDMLSVDRSIIPPYQEQLWDLQGKYPNQFAVTEVLLSLSQSIGVQKFEIMPFIEGNSLMPYEHHYAQLENALTQDNTSETNRLYPIYSKAFLETMLSLARKIPQRHFNDFVGLFSFIKSLGGQCDFAHIHNVLYNKQKGFELLDISFAGTLSPEATSIYSFAKCLVGQKGIILKESDYQQYLQYASLTMRKIEEACKKHKEYFHDDLLDKIQYNRVTARLIVQ